MDKTQAAKAARAKLLEQEKRTAVAIVREYRAIIERLEKEITDLTAAIQSARKAGLTPIGFLIEQNRLKTILDAVSREFDDAAARLALYTLKAQAGAVTIARKQIETTGELSAKTFSFDAAATRKLAGQTADGAPLANYFARLARPVRQSFFNILTYGMATGAPSPQIAAELRDAIKANASRALTIVRTESNRAYRAASLQYYRSAEIQKYRWISALDLRTCPVCWALHGKTFSTQTPFGSHINCRCTMVAVLPDESEIETGAAAFAKLNEAQQKTILGAARFDLYRRGARLSAFVKTKKNEFGISRTLKPLNEIEFKEKVPA